MKKVIKYLLSVMLLTLSFSALLFGSTRGDVKIIEASENIQYLSQKISIDYFLLYNKPNDTLLKRNLNDNIDKISLNMKEILQTSKSEETREILKFFLNQLIDIRGLIEEEKNIENASTILEYAEEFIEGTDSIIEEHKYNYTAEEKMLMLSKKAQYLFEYVTSYYMASKIGLVSLDNRMKMNEAIGEIDSILVKINEYEYSPKLKKNVTKISRIWKVNKVFFTNETGLFIPHILLHSTQYSQNILIKIEDYHKKNL